MSIEVIIPNRTTSDVNVNINPDINANENQRIANENQRIINEQARQERYNSLIDYNNQINKPKINNTELIGNKSLDDLGIQGKETGKGLSTNDFTNTYKQNVDNNTSARHTHNNKTILDDISSTDINNWNNKSNFSGSYNDLTDKPNIPSQTSDLQNDSGFIINTVNDLLNYYKKTDTYTQTEVNNLIGAIQQFHYEIVQTLPQTGANNVLYLVSKSTAGTNDVYDEYVYANNGWERIGSTQIDLSGYATETWVNTQIADFLTESEIENLIASSISTYSLHEINASIGSEKTYSLVKDGQDVGDKIEIIQDTNLPIIMGNFSLEISMISGGSGYAIGEKIETDIQNFDMKFEVLDVDNNGAITKLAGCFMNLDSAKYIGNLNYNEINLTLTDDDLYAFLDGSGLSLNLRIYKNSRAYYGGLGFKYFSDAKIINGGSGYSVNDYVFADCIKSTGISSGYPICFKVTEVDSNGSVLGISAIPTGSNFVRTYSTKPNYQTFSLLTSGNGTGLQVELIPIKKLSSTYMHEKEDIENKVKAISNNSTDTEYPSAKCVYTQLNSKENSSNKVTSISSQSTDTQYPSAKCVYDLVGDIETILTALTTGSGV